MGGGGGGGGGGDGYESPMYLIYQAVCDFLRKAHIKKLWTIKCGWVFYLYSYVSLTLRYLVD